MCIAPSRFCVEDSAAERFIARFKAEAEALRVGDSQDVASTMGSLMLASGREKIEQPTADTLTRLTMDEYKKVASQQIQRENGLTPQEVRVLRLLAAGGRSLDIANELALTEVTAKRKVQEITPKLGAAIRVQTVAEAIKRGVS